MEKLILAVATEDGKTYTNEHFGDAKYFDIYQISAQNYEFVKRVENTTQREEEHEAEHHHHGDQKKASGIIQLMKQNGVQVMVAKVFGPNLKKVKKHFVCVYMDNTNIEQSLEKLQKNFNILVEEWQKGENRNYLNFSKLS